MHRRPNVVLILVSVAAVVGLLSIVPLVTPVARAAFTGTNGLIAFVRSASGNSEIYTMKADGTSQTNISDDGATDDMPVWSPDGTKIAFTSNRAGNFEIYVMNANGSGLTRLTNSPAIDWQPAWSADGTKIAFTRDGPGEQAIYTVPAAGGTPTLLLDGAHSPAYSPDGTRLAYVDMEADDASGEVYVLTLSSMGKQQITWNSLADEDPEWSPDGTMVAVSRFDTAGEGLVNMEVWVVEANGYLETKLAGPEAMYPAWSPDQTKIAYSGYDGANWDIYVTGSSPGGTPTRFTTAAGVDGEPNWQPAPPPTTLGDEGLIAFTSTRDGNAEIYIMNPNGTAATRLTNDPAMDDFAAISPDGTEVAFTSWRDGDAEIYIVDASGADPTLTKVTDNTAYDAEPTWSSDGAALMYVSDRGGSEQLWFTTLDDSAVFGPYGPGGIVSDFSPDWSDLGVVYVNDQDGDNELYTFIPDRTAEVPLTANSVSDYGPAWAPEPPDATFHNVMFVRGVSGGGDLYQIAMTAIPEPGDPVPTAYQVTNTTAWEFSPTWRGDSTWIAFSRAQPGDFASAEIWLRPMEGEQQYQLTDTAGANYNPHWGPCTVDADGYCDLALPPGPEKHARTITLDLHKHLWAEGRVTCPDPVAGCTDDVKVKIQRKVQGGWENVRSTFTDDEGWYLKELPDVPGTYRAVAKLVKVGGEVCAKAMSNAVLHEH